MAKKVIDLDEITLERKIGRGALGVVYEAKWKSKKVVVKKLIREYSETLPQEIQVQLQSLPKHPCVIEFFGFGIHESTLYIVMELAENGSLYEYLHTKKATPSEERSYTWALDIAKGLKHLHDSGIKHGDLKSSKVLFSTTYTAMLSDFGTSLFKDANSPSNLMGTYHRWMSPEVMKADEAKQKMTDIYSYGIVLNELFAHEIPYADVASVAMIVIAVLQGKHPTIASTLPSYAHDLLLACWEEDPIKRPNAAQIIDALENKVRVAIIGVKINMCLINIVYAYCIYLHSNYNIIT